MMEVPEKAGKGNIFNFNCQGIIAYHFGVFILRKNNYVKKRKTLSKDETNKVNFSGIF